MVLISLLAIYS